MLVNIAKRAYFKPTEMQCLDTWPHLLKSRDPFSRWSIRRTWWLMETILSFYREWQWTIIRLTFYWVTSSIYISITESRDLQDLWVKWSCTLVVIYLILITYNSMWDIFKVSLSIVHIEQRNMMTHNMIFNCLAY